MSYDNPIVQFDAENNVHVLHATAPKNYLYTVVSLDGKVMKREAYQATTAKPQLVRTADGSIALVGGILNDPTAPKVKETLRRSATGRYRSRLRRRIRRRRSRTMRRLKIYFRAEFRDKELVGILDLHLYLKRAPFGGSPRCDFRDMSAVKTVGICLGRYPALLPKNDL